MQDVEYTPNADPWFSLLSHELCAGARYHAVNNTPELSKPRSFDLIAGFKWF
jgi:hypothetical protein